LNSRSNKVLPNGNLLPTFTNDRMVIEGYLWPTENILSRKTQSMKRTVLFPATNAAVLLVLSFSARILGVDRYLASQGLNMGMLL
jgi:hypothetical protein